MVLNLRTETPLSPSQRSMLLESSHPCDPHLLEEGIYRYLQYPVFRVLQPSSSAILNLRVLHFTCGSYCWTVMLSRRVSPTAIQGV